MTALPKVAQAVQTAAVESVPPPPPAAGTAPAAATSVQMLVAMSAAAPAPAERRRAAAATDKGLRQLEALHRELLQGAPAAPRLRELDAWVTAFDVPEDPLLAGIARDLEIRVRVELAKHELLA